MDLLIKKTQHFRVKQNKINKKTVTFTNILYEKSYNFISTNYIWGLHCNINAHKFQDCDDDIDTDGVGPIENNPLINDEESERTMLLGRGAQQFKGNLANNNSETTTNQTNIYMHTCITYFF